MIEKKTDGTNGKKARKGSPWTPERIDFLKENYPLLGRNRCAELMGLTHGQVREKASRLGLKARGVSEAWNRKNKEHSEILKGRKRPEQSQVMKELHAAGKLTQSAAQIEAASISRKKWYSKNEHPRGSLGLKHTPETKESLSKTLTAYQNSLSEEEKAAKVMKMMKSRVKNGTYAPERPKTTWKSGWREIGGSRKYYRSKWEANYAHYLEWLKNKGEIIEWQHEPTTFWFEGIKRGCVSYLPDFRVVDSDGKESYHEVKGWMDARSKTKIKRMAKYHPQVDLIVVDSKVYGALRKKVASLVPGWEP